jgi:thiamine pyrophosphate-dependent acetolactate synthase large subunit-like protein
VDGATLSGVRAALEALIEEFTANDFVKYAESFGARGYQIKAAADLLPTLRKALDDDGVSVIACPGGLQREHEADGQARRAD